MLLLNFIVKYHILFSKSRLPEQRWISRDQGGLEQLKSQGRFSSIQKKHNVVPRARPLVLVSDLYALTQEFVPGLFPVSYPLA